MSVGHLLMRVKAHIKDKQGAKARRRVSLMGKVSLREKYQNTEFFLVRIFLYSD